MSDAIVTTTVLPIPPPDAFDVFTVEVDLWWRRGPRHRFVADRDGTLAFEGAVGGRFVERYGDGDVFEIGRIHLWEPPVRLSFDLRLAAFAVGERTVVDVQFLAVPEGTRVTVTHRGWSALSPDHPARRGLRGPAFADLQAMWWGDLLVTLRHRGVATGRQKRPG